MVLRFSACEALLSQATMDEQKSTTLVRMQQGACYDSYRVLQGCLQQSVDEHKHEWTTSQDANMAAHITGLQLGHTKLHVGRVRHGVMHCCLEQRIVETKQDIHPQAANCMLR
jgi:hypothetical protein